MTRNKRLPIQVRKRKTRFDPDDDFLEILLSTESIVDLEGLLPSDDEYREALLSSNDWLREALLSSDDSFREILLAPDSIVESTVDYID